MASQIFIFSQLSQKKICLTSNSSLCPAHLVDGLGDGRLHEINITDNLRRKCVPQVLMELSILQVV